MTDEPLHVQAIAFLQRRISKRRDELRAKAGNGLDDQQYQRTVGAIRECTSALNDLDDLRKQIVTAMEDEENDDDAISGESRESRRSSPHREPDQGSTSQGRSGNPARRRARRPSA